MRYKRNISITIASPSPNGILYQYCAKKYTEREEAGPKKDTARAILLAAKFGIAELVEKILDRFSVAISDKDEDGKNVLLLAVENRNLELYKLLISRYDQKDVIFHIVDKEGNTALHYAAMYNQDNTKPWPVPGAALQMQWEIKWHEVINEVYYIFIYMKNEIISLSFLYML